MSPGGRLSLAELLPARGTHLAALLDLGGEPPEFAERLREAEERVYRDAEDPLTAWDAGGLLAGRGGGRAAGSGHGPGAPRRTALDPA